MTPDRPSADGSPHFQRQAELAIRPRSEIATAPLMTHAPLAVAVTVTTAAVADALLLVVVGLFAGLSVFTPPELIPFVSRLLAGCAALLTVIRCGFSVAMWAGGRAAHSEPNAVALIGFTRVIVGAWWWTAAMVLILGGVAVALLAGWPTLVIAVLAGATMVFGLLRAGIVVLSARRGWAKAV